jgi:hypothetical protein
MSLLRKTRSQAEIRRIADQSQPEEIVCKTLSKKIHHKKGLAE